jgi:hypothetical protein
VYSTVDKVDYWPVREYPLAGAPGTDGTWREFLARYTVRNWVRWKELYDAVGLNAVASTIVILKRLAGVLPPAVPDPTIKENEWAYSPGKIRDGGYSIKELALMLHDIGFTQWGGGWSFFDDGNGNLSSPISLREVLDVLRTFSPDSYTSIQDALAQ